MCFQNVAPRPLRPPERKTPCDSNRRIKSHRNVYKNERGIQDILPSLGGRVTCAQKHCKERTRLNFREELQMVATILVFTLN